MARPLPHRRRTADVAALSYEQARDELVRSSTSSSRAPPPSRSRSRSGSAARRSPRAARSGCSAPRSASRPRRRAGAAPNDRRQATPAPGSARAGPRVVAELGRPETPDETARARPRTLASTTARTRPRVNLVARDPRVAASCCSSCWSSCVPSGTVNRKRSTTGRSRSAEAQTCRAARRAGAARGLDARTGAEIDDRRGRRRRRPGTSGSSPRPSSSSRSSRASTPTTPGSATARQGAALDRRRRRSPASTGRVYDQRDGRRPGQLRLLARPRRRRQLVRAARHGRRRRVRTCHGLAAIAARRAAGPHPTRPDDRDVTTTPIAAAPRPPDARRGLAAT